MTYDERTFVTVWSNGYALVTWSPTGPVATLLTPAQAERHFDAGTNYVETLDDGDGLTNDQRTAVLAELEIADYAIQFGTGAPE